ncbi:FAD-containing monooxygenase EthA [Bacterioplanes sanyensis]|uniref:FAD-containing monooxygenase EthA n=1 Tax=Bacterioplanes sanyensis TaxID=1249553 RepID=A0A222FKC4_9GAMM|nr:NAD(P)/FAD-dependent oxidoreductase [Bacterioplanes sanyensis]ASP38964.1 FAD-containing monooxygenase EthA [Bacterioplanes sanyensis]
MAADYFDVIIIGAGLSGIGAACHLQRECPEKTFTILEGRTAIGGTWDLFRYPGIRSDSDMFTLGYAFKPWLNKKGIADGDDIRHYIEEAAAEHNIQPHIRFQQRVKSAHFCSQRACWTLEVEQHSGDIQQYRCQFLLGCTGYYDYQQGFTPEFKGRESFNGDIIHPQQWPENYRYDNKKVVVIGSGATAVTLVPAMADKAEHVTMLQRSPSYVITVPQQDPTVTLTRKLLPKLWAYRLIRGRNISITLAIYRFCKRFPSAARKFLQWTVKKQLPNDANMEHFTPKYAPWDERLCAVPDGDLFKAIDSKQASVVTGHIDRFNERGIVLTSGQQLDADVIITATGLNIQMLGGMEVFVDGNAFEPNSSMSYRGVMFENLPNMAMVFGYTNASWTLKADLISRYVCRLLRHMDHKGVRQVVPQVASGDIQRSPFIDMQSGYIARVKDQLPKQGSRRPWKLYQNYFLDMLLLKFANMDDPSLHYSSPRTKDELEPSQAH